MPSSNSDFYAQVSRNEFSVGTSGCSVLSDSPWSIPGLSMYDFW